MPKRPVGGFIDLVEPDEAAGYTNVIDIKTSRGRYSPADVEERGGQLEIYLAAVEPMVREFGLPIRVGFEVVTKAKAPTVERHFVNTIVEPIERQARAASVIVDTVSSGLFWPALPGWYCATCPYRDPNCRAW